jgi:flagellar assembly factor FliW
MRIRTTHFGPVQIASSDIFQFPLGLIGFEGCRQWILLADNSNEAIGWLQSATHEEVALPVISPRRFVPDYRLHLRGEQLLSLQLDDQERVFVLNIVSKNGGLLTANLKAPVILNLDRRLGCQVVLSENHALQHVLHPVQVALRKSA